MLAVLVVGPDTSEIVALEQELASVEILRARGLEDALEKLGRNRRIDAVLLLGGPAESVEIAGAIHDDNPAPPPLFLSVSSDGGGVPPVGVRRLSPGSPRELLDALIREIAR